MTKTVEVRITADRHIHCGLEIPRGGKIPLRPAQAERLVNAQRAEYVTAPPKATTKE